MPQRHHALVVAALVSVLLHASLMLPWGMQRRGSDTPGHQGQTLRIEIMQPAPRVPPLSPEPPPTDKPTAQPKNPSSDQRPTPPSAVADLPSEAAAPEGSAFGEHYYPVAELSDKPSFLRDTGGPTPTYMPDVLPLPVLASVYINEYGTVDDVQLSESFLSDTAKSFITASFMAMVFSPGRIGTLPVKSVLQIEVRLDPALPSR